MSNLLSDEPPTSPTPSLLPPSTPRLLLLLLSSTENRLAFVRSFVPPTALSEDGRPLVLFFKSFVSFTIGPGKVELLNIRREKKMTTKYPEGAPQATPTLVHPLPRDPLPRRGKRGLSESKIRLLVTAR